MHVCLTSNTHESINTTVVLIYLNPTYRRLVDDKSDQVILTLITVEFCIMYYYVIKYLSL